MNKSISLLVLSLILSGCSDGRTAASPEQVESIVATEQAHADVSPEYREQMRERAEQEQAANENRKAQEREQIESTRRACEAIHPLLSGDCDTNAAIDYLTDSAM